MQNEQTKANELQLLLAQLIGKRVILKTAEYYVDYEVKIKKAEIHDNRVKIELDLGNLKITNCWADVELFKEVV